MLPRLFNRRLLAPEDLTPSRPDLKVVGAFNPGAIATAAGVTVFARVAEAPAENRPGLTGLPRWDPDRGTTVDWVRNDEIEALDPRVVRIRRTGRVRLTFISHLAVITSPDGRSLPRGAPGLVTPVRFEPAAENEEFGVEDPRIVRFDSAYYFTYVAVSRHGAATALASTSDFRSFRRHGIIFPPENKDVLLFPERIAGEYAAIHRPNPATPFGPPEMWIARSPDLVHWGRHRHLLTGASAWDGGRIGGGAPPIRTEDGWMEIYHGAGAPAKAGEAGTYAAGLMLLDLENPERILRRSPEPIMVPEAEFERGGFVSNVVFPTGAVETADTTLVYYGAADAVTGVVEFSKRELREALFREELTA